MKNKILCISTARKNSKSIKNKNLIKIKNIPMLYHNIYSALNVKKIDKVVLTTDIKIKKISNKKFDRIERPRSLSHNKSSHKKTIIHCLKKIEIKSKSKFDYIVLILGNSIGATTMDLNKAINIITKNNKIDSLVSVIELNMFNPCRAMCVKNKKIFFPFFKQKKNANDKNAFGNFFFFNGSFMIFKRKCLFQNGIGPFNWLGKNIIPYVQTKTFMEIDSKWQLDMLKGICKEK